MCKFTPACHCPGTSGCVWAGKGACLSRASSKALKQEKEASEGGSDNSGSSDTKVLAYGASSVPSITSLDDVLSSAEFLNDEAFRLCGFEYEAAPSSILMDDLAPRLASQERVADDFGVGHAHNPQECYYGAPPTAEETLAVGRGLPALQQQQQQHSAWALGGGVLPSLHHTLAPLPAKATSVPSAASGGGRHQGPKRRRCSFPRATTKLLKLWLRNHIMHPYPSEAEKKELCAQCNLTLSQLQTWFINARIRLWKPCIEHVYAQKKQQLKRMEQERGSMAAVAAAGGGGATTKVVMAGHVPPKADPGGETLAMIAKLRTLPDLQMDRAVSKFFL